MKIGDCLHFTGLPLGDARPDKRCKAGITERLRKTGLCTIERVKLAREAADLIDAAQGACYLLLKAIESGDPRRELQIRVRDLERILDPRPEATVKDSLTVGGSVIGTEETKG